MAGGLDLGKQVGPLPLGAWIAVVGGGLAIGWYASKGGTKTGAADETQVPLTEPGVGTGGGQFIYEPPTTVDSPGSDVIPTNDEWRKKAVNYLISIGVDPGVAQTAITKFITGQDRSATEQFYISQALLHFGAPPEDVPVPPSPIPVPSVPGRPGTPGPAPSRPRAWNFYTVRAGDTPGKITAKFPGLSWWNIYVVNDKLNLRPDGTPGILGNPYSLKPGMVLLIPTKDSGLVTKVPGVKTANVRYYTTVRGDTLGGIAKKYHIHEWNLFTANDVVGMRADGSRGFLRGLGDVKPGQRLIIPYQ